MQRAVFEVAIVAEGDRFCQFGTKYVLRQRQIKYITPDRFQIQNTDEKGDESTRARGTAHDLVWRGTVAPTT